MNRCDKIFGDSMFSNSGENVPNNGCQKLTAPREFPFPFTPYNIQHDFMTHLYEVMEDGKLGIFESPTGTGKSLSLICGALRWLLDHEERYRRNLDWQVKDLKMKLTQLKVSSESSIDWLSQQAEEIEIREQLNTALYCLDALRKREEEMNKIHSRQHESKESTLFQDTRKEESTTKLTDGDEEEVLLAEYEDNEEQLSDEVDEKKEREPNLTQIYFCSRTHSQLAQLVSEVRRSPYGEAVRVVPLASRSSCCINEHVRRLGSNSLINERCLELQHQKQRATECEKSHKRRRIVGQKRCPYRQREKVEVLRDKALSSVLDVEELVAAGKKLEACPYYAAREAATLAQVVLVPYNTLLHKSTRDACGIHLKDSIIIVDEAHNLLESIGNIHSYAVSGHQLSYAYSQLIQYQQRFLRRFSAVNLLRLEQLIFVISKLIRMLGGKPGCHPHTETGLQSCEPKIYTLPDFMLSAEIDNINPHILLEFCRRSKLAQKIQRFGELYVSTVTVHSEKESGIKALLREIASSNSKKFTKEKTDSEPDSVQSGMSKEFTGGNPLLPVLSLLESLTTKSEDGRLLVSTHTIFGKSKLQFVLLNPAIHFEPIVKEARCVIVAGGTMQPMSEFSRLFLTAGATLERVTQFSCGHVIPQESILPLVITRGPSGTELDFSYQKRSCHQILHDLGRILVNVCNVVPAGIVCFFPSYEFENMVYNYFEANGVISKIEQKKRVFREPKTSGMVEQVLAEYSSCIEQSLTSRGRGGALMFSVVGGKLSEGLNFNDDLGRCIIVIGLPYPSIKSPEMQEKMSYLNTEVGPGAGRDYYENLCMKAVNQSVGRSVRHRGDYAAVLLLDRRYASTHIQSALPSWVRASLCTEERFSHALSTLCKPLYEAQQVLHGHVNTT